jgi:putative transposase
MFIEKGYRKKLVCKELQIQRSVVYYLNKDNKPGRKASAFTMFKNELVTEQTVLTSVKSILDHEFLSYGYFKISKQLKIDGFVINKKKVYRIMKN